MPAVDLSQSAARSRQPKPPETPEIIEAVTGFIVYLKKDESQPTGYQIVLSPDINVPIKPDRQPTHDEVLMYLEIVKKDIIGQQYANMSAGANLSMQSFLGQQLAAQQQAESLGDLRV